MSKAQRLPEPILNIYKQILSKNLEKLAENIIMNFESEKYLKHILSLSNEQEDFRYNFEYSVLPCVHFYINISQSNDGSGIIGFRKQSDKETKNFFGHQWLYSMVEYKNNDEMKDKLLEILQDLPISSYE